MIINPSAHTIIPRVNSFKYRSQRRGRQVMSAPGGKLLWFAVTRVLSVTTLLFFVASLWLGSSVTQVNMKIDQVADQHDELVNANILLRAKKARLFSPEAVGLLAGNQLAIYLPQSDQYRKF
jgi:hypothetical protein